MVGELPVRGNGPSLLDLYRQGKNAGEGTDRQERFRAVLNDEPAPPPRVSMTRVPKHGEGGLSRSGSTRTLGRRLSIKKIKGLAKGKSSPDLKGDAGHGSGMHVLSVPKASKPILTSHFDYNKFEDKPLPGIPKESKGVSNGKRKGKPNGHSDPKGHRRKSMHVDLFDAVPAIKQSQKDEAGRRNYGEDVADRNISMYTPQSTRTSIDSRHHAPNHVRGKSDAGVAYRSPPVSDADWLNQPWVQEGTKPWEEVRKERRSSGARSTRSVRSLRQDAQQDWPMRDSSHGIRSKSDVRNAFRVNKQLPSPEATDDDSFELGAVTVSDDIFYPG